MEIKAFKGLNNTTSPERMKPGELAVALDVDVDNTGRLLSRVGTAVINATPSHSLYAYEAGVFLSQDASLYAVEANLALTFVRTLTSAAHVSYDSTNGVAYFSNGIDTGRFIGRTPKKWGVIPPNAQPIGQVTTGALPPGTYAYALTFIRADGHESGTGLAGQITLTATGGINFSSIAVSSDPDVVSKGLYVTSCNGEVMYLATTIPNAQVVATVASEPLAGIPLTTQFAGPAPAGTKVLIFNGIAYVVAGNVVYYSDPYNLELFRPETSFLQFPGTISLFDWVNDGIYVATSDSEGDGSEGAGTTWFMSGTRPDKFNPKQVFNYGSTPGTSVRVEAGFFGPQVERIGQPALIWTSRHGICVGADGGTVHNLTETRYSFPAAQDGAAMVRQRNGFVQYIVSQQGTGDANNAYEETI